MFLSLRVLYSRSRKRFFNKTIAMDAVYLLLMAFHVVGVMFTVRMLLSCFRDKEKYPIFQKCRAVIMLQSILHLVLLALNVDESTKVFSNELQLEWCTTNCFLNISVGFVLIYNLLAMLAIEHPSVVCLKRSLSPQAAMLGTLTAGVSTAGILYWAGFYTVEILCASQIVSTVACSLLLLLMLSIVWQICRNTAEYATTTNSSVKSSYNLMDLLSKNKTTISVTVCFLLLVALTFSLKAILSVINFHDIKQMEEIWFFERVLYLFVTCFGVGIPLPIIFQQMIDFSANAEPINDYCNEKTFSV